MTQNLKLTPAALSGVVRVPPSKSIAHRAVLCAALARDGESAVHGLAWSDDIVATIQGARALGAQLAQDGEILRVRGAAPARSLEEDAVLIDCNESGSTLRFLLPIALALGRPTRFIGRGNLGKRPLDAYYKIMREQGIGFDAAEGKLDLTVRGQLRPGRFVLPGNVSSQYITGLLLALPLLDAPSEIVVEGPLESKGYLDLTMQVMRAFEVEVSYDGDRVFCVPSGGYRPAQYTVEGDFSQAAFFLAAGALAGVRATILESGGDAAGALAGVRTTILESGGDAVGAFGGVQPPNGEQKLLSPDRIRIAGLCPDSAQGDRAVCDILKAMGATVEWDADGNLWCTARHLHGCVIDAAQYPDIIPVLSAVACACEGETRIVNAGRLRMKECDRLSAVARELSALGASVEEGEDFLRISGWNSRGWPLRGGGEVWSHADHRMAMTLAVAAAVCEQSFALRDYPCVSKSYPNFFDDYRRLGGVCCELDLGNQM